MRRKIRPRHTKPATHGSKRQSHGGSNLSAVACCGEATGGPSSSRPPFLTTSPSARASVERGFGPRLLTGRHSKPPLQDLAVPKRRGPDNRASLPQPKVVCP